MNGSQGIGMTKNYKETVIKELKSRGYDGMVDEGCVGGIGKNQREGIEPIIIFDGDKYLDKKATVAIDDETRNKATKNYNKWFSKVNHNRKSNKW